MAVAATLRDEPCQSNRGTPKQHFRSRGRLLHCRPMASSAGYVPGQWGNFFVLVGTGAAALTGLVFVALTINLKAVTQDATHRYRAINMLTGLTAAFVIAALALMGAQTYRTIGSEWLVVSLLAAAINTNGYVQGFRLGSGFALNRFRIVGGSACYLGQVIGAVMLCLDAGVGIYISAVALILNFFFLVSGSWLLIVGTAPDSN
jgi:hypothetical protein